MKPSLALALLATGLAATGCGGTGATGSSTSGRETTGGTSQSRRPTAALTKSQLIEKADTICQRMNAEFAAHEPRSDSIAESARIVPHRVLIEQRVLAELGRLAPPSAIAPDLHRIIAFRKTLALELAELAQVAERRDTARFHKLATSKARVHSELLAAAKGTGFKECGQTG
jgi:hypothetical protein